jgi:hypothetical protein
MIKIPWAKVAVVENLDHALAGHAQDKEATTVGIAVGVFGNLQPGHRPINCIAAVAGKCVGRAKRRSPSGIRLFKELPNLSDYVLWGLFSHLLTFSVKPAAPLSSEDTAEQGGGQATFGVFRAAQMLGEEPQI